MGADEIAEAGARARRHRGHRRDDARGLPDHDRARRGARPALHDDRRPGARPAATRPILRASATRSPRARGVTVSDDALDVLLDFADQSIINRRFPDKAIDLLEQAVAAALVAGRTTVDRDDARRDDRALGAARVVDADARAVRARPRRARPRRASSARSSAATARSTRSSRSCCAGPSATRCCSGPAGSGKTAIVEGLAIRHRRRARCPTPLARRPDLRRRRCCRSPRASPPSRRCSTTSSSRRATRRSSSSSTRSTCSPSPAVRDLGRGAQAGARPRRDRLHRRHDRRGVPGQPRAGRGARAPLHARSRSSRWTRRRSARSCVAVRDSLAQGARRDGRATRRSTSSIALADQFLPNRCVPGQGRRPHRAVGRLRAHATAQTTVDVADGARGRGRAGRHAARPDRARSRRWRPSCATAALLDAGRRDALLGRLGVSLRGLDAQPRAARRRGPAVRRRGRRRRRRSPTTLARDLFGRETARHRHRPRRA